MAPLTALRTGPTTDDAGWRTRAVCAQPGYSPDDFMPTGTHGRYRNDIKQACHRCPVRRECLEAAISSPWPPYGLWAGMSARELERLWANHHPHYRTVMANLGIPNLTEDRVETSTDNADGGRHE